MKPKVLRQEDYLQTTWDGGLTTQLFILPQIARYAKRDFTLRISKASINIPSSDFTHLPGISRKLLLLQGELHLTFPQQKLITLTPGKHIAFNGKDSVHCKGMGTDFNVMVQGEMASEVQYQRLEKGASLQVDFTPANQLIFLYISIGSIQVKWGGLNQVLEAEMSCYLPSLSQEQPLIIQAIETCTLVLTEVWRPKK